MRELEYIYNALNGMIVDLAGNPNLIEKYLIGSKQHGDVSKMFVRETKLSLSRLLMFMMMPRAGSCQSELTYFYGGIEMEVPSKSAFSMKRKLVSYKLFPFINSVLLDHYYMTSMPRKWKGKFIVAVDGTTLTMPRGERFEALYGYSTWEPDKSLRVPMARAIVLYDVLNHQIIEIRLDKYGSYEAEMAYETIMSLPDYIRNNAIFIFDRAFISSWFLTVLQNMGICYIMRCRRGQSKAIDNFWNNRLSSQDVLISMSSVSWYTKGRERYDKNGITPDKRRPVFVHLSKSKLSDGEYEVICSSLFGIKLSAAQAYRLYGRRWEIETAIGIEKNEFQIEILSGYSKNAILQDIYCKIISYNICSMAMMVANKRLKVRSKRRTVSNKRQTVSNKKPLRSSVKVIRRYKLNMNMALCYLKQLFVKIVTDSIKLHALIVRYIREICRYYEPVHKNSHNRRVFRAYKSHGKYATYTNYARVM